ncbi:MAG: hypothetical protein WA817_20175 [Candidatus Acidiferrum sp.]
MKMLLIATAFIEVGAGLALLLLPSQATELLFGSPLGTPTALVMGRLAGVALLTLGVACWLGRSEEKSHRGNGLAAAMLLYNAAAVALISYARIGLGLIALLLWPAVLLHAVMAVWCVACLRSKRA